MQINYCRFFKSPGLPHPELRRVSLPLPLSSKKLSYDFIGMLVIVAWSWKAYNVCITFRVLLFNIPYLVTHLTPVPIPDTHRRFRTNEEYHLQAIWWAIVEIRFASLLLGTMFALMNTNSDIETYSSNMKLVSSQEPTKGVVVIKSPAWVTLRRKLE